MKTGLACNSMLTETSTNACSYSSLLWQVTEFTFAKEDMRATLAVVCDFVYSPSMDGL